MHGLGNDYIVIDNREQKISDIKAPELAKTLCERHFSIGADGLLLLQSSNVANVKMRILNSDGSEAEMCGNGIRCFSKYCYENGFVTVPIFKVETLSGTKDVSLTIEDHEVTSVKVDMNSPKFERSDIPMKGQGTCIDQLLEVNGQTFRVTCLSLGNPHCIIFVDDVATFPVDSIGPMIEEHDVFPRRTNVEFVQVLNSNEIKVRVWERGCGETLACGTGTCASVAAAHLLGKVGEKVAVHVLGGDLQVDVGETIFLIGSAEKVFEGILFKEI
jgi:diaminopimelate epimerase